jgi:hypothetical protein
MAFERTTVDPARMGGLPTIRGTRVTVGMVLGQLASGRTIADVSPTTRTSSGMTSSVLSRMPPPS